MSEGRATALATLVAMVLMVVLQLAVATRQGLWGDEIFSLAMATGHSLEHPAGEAEPAKGDFVEPAAAVPAAEFRRYVTHREPAAGPADVVRAVRLSDTSPPLYYLLLSGWTRLWGTGDLALRGFSMVCGLACVPWLAAIGRRLGGTVPAAATVVLFAVNPVVIYYTTEGRMYALLWLLVVALMWLTLRWTETGPRTGVVAAWAATAAAGFWVHYFFVFPWAAAVGFLVLRRPADWRRVGLALAALAFLVLPWYRGVPEALGAWRVTAGWLELEPVGFSWLQGVRRMLLQAWSGYANVWPPRRKAELAALLVVSVVALVALWRGRARLAEGPRLLIWAWAVAAVLGPVVFDLLMSTYTTAVPRYASTLVPAGMLLAALWVHAVGHRVAWLVVPVLAVVWAPNMVRLRQADARGWQLFREVAQVATRDLAAGDVAVVHSIPSGVIGIARYAPAELRMAAWVGQLGQREVPRDIETMIAGAARVIFVRVHDVGEPAPQEEWLHEHADTERTHNLAGAVATVFKPRAGGSF